VSPHSRTFRSRHAIVTVLLLVCTASAASGQNYSFDARRIALGGAGGTPNVASKLVERQRRYKSILIPVGLVKLLSDVRVFFPNREDFDFSRAVQYSSSPLHFVFGRREDITARSFFRDIVHASLQPDLNSYSGFALPIVTETIGTTDESAARSENRVAGTGTPGRRGRSNRLRSVTESRTSTSASPAPMLSWTNASIS